MRFQSEMLSSLYVKIKVKKIFPTKLDVPRTAFEFGTLVISSYDLLLSYKADIQPDTSTSDSAGIFF